MDVDDGKYRLNCSDIGDKGGELALEMELKLELVVVHVPMVLS